MAILTNLDIAAVSYNGQNIPLAGGGSPTLQTKNKTYTPSTSQQTESVVADSGYDGLSAVNVTVNAMPSGTEGTPVATKGSVSNHSVSVTPSVTNSAGYISGGTKTGTPVSVTASELDSGTKSISANGNNQDVVGYAEVDVNVPNSYSASDEGKVVLSGALVSQSSQSISSNGTYDTTLKNEVVVSVPNSYSASDEGKVVSNGALVSQSSDTVTQNGTVDTTLINSLIVNVPTGGSGVKSGSFTPSSRTLSVTFDTGLSTINGILIVPKNANPLKSNGRTAIAIIITPNDYYKSIHICSNNSGSSFLTPNASTSSTRMTQSGTNVTVTTVSNVGGYFETIEYTWFAW